MKVGNKYIEIHNKESHFILNTNFEDIEFANAINNITFAKKDNKIELNIKEAFKLSSINNKIEVSMLNKAIADLSNNSTATNSEAGWRWLRHRSCPSWRPRSPERPSSCRSTRRFPGCA